MERANEFKQCRSPTCQEAVFGKSFNCSQCDKSFCRKCSTEHVCSDSVDATDGEGVSRRSGGFEGHQGTNMANSHLSSAGAVVPRSNVGVPIRNQSSGQVQTIFFSRECSHVLNDLSVSTLKCKYCSFVYCEDSKCLTHHYSKSRRCQSSSTKADLTMLGFVQGSDSCWSSSTSSSTVGGGTLGGGAFGGGTVSGGAVGGGSGIDIAQCPGKVFDPTYTCYGKAGCPYCN